ncbi:MAG: polyprenyl synthetase family protein [Candidatus Dormibacteria bacterium]|jgi:geranylgeranyl diphosphate synthase type I
MAVAIRQLQPAFAPLEKQAAARIPDPLRRQLPALAAALRATALPAGTRVGAMSAYHIGWTDADGRPRRDGGGKFLRGCLALWAAERCGRGDDALPVAAAVEWIHNFTLVHDDIQDGDRERRHHPTVWAVWGQAQAINAGDGMHAVAYRAVLSGRDRPQARLRAAAAINGAILQVIEGQCLDLALEGQIDTTAATYLRLARAKTGALIGAALEAGALISGADARRARQLRRAGVELGVAFQIRDDWLGTWGDSEVTGKGCGGDLARRKLTYPVVVGQSRLRGAARRELRRLYTRSGGDEDRILALLDEAGAADAVTLELRRRSRSALQLVAACGLADDAVADFREIVEFIVERAA